MDTAKAFRALEMIANDMRDDAANFDGKPFNGRTVAEYFGNQGAAIAALANIVKGLLESASSLSESNTPASSSAPVLTQLVDPEVRE